MPLKSQLSPDQADAYKEQSASAPSVSDDANAGFILGDKWLKTSAPRASYEVIDTTPGAAVWKDITAAAGSHPVNIAAVDPTASDDGFNIGDHWINTVTDTVFQIVDNTASAAVWIKLYHPVKTSTVDPTATDDDYDIGTHWINTTDGTIFQIIDNTASNAIWKEVNHPVKTSTVDPTVNDDDTAGYAVGDHWINTTTNTVFQVTDVSTGAAIWKTATSTVQQAALPNEIMFGTLLDYPAQGSSAAGEIQYIRLRLIGGTSFSGMKTFLDSGGSASRYIRFGIYDQTDPDDDTLGPDTRLVQTAQTATGGDGYISASFIGGDYTIPSTGFYWIAIVQDSTVINYAVTGSNRADFLPVRREDPGATADLPATAGTLTNPVSALIFVSLLEA